MFGAHEDEGRLWTHAPLSKNYYYKAILNLQNQSHNPKQIEGKKIKTFQGVLC
jgi:hypothetical protein